LPPARAFTTEAPHMSIQRRALIGSTAASGLMLLASSGRVRAQARPTLRFGVGPLLPTAEDTRKTFTPVFAHLAEQIKVDFELFVTADWAGMAVAMGSGQLDVAWMGPWGYVIAHHSTGCVAIATVKYDEKPVYHAIVIGGANAKVGKFPDDTKGMSISFADVGSTSGWLIPSWYAKEVWKIDPKTFWRYREGASHPANEIAVQAGQVDLATDFDRNRNAMIASGRIAPDGTKILWTSAPLPNDAIAVPKSMPAERADRIRKVLTSITVEQAKTLLPSRYTGFVAATHASYADIEKAGLALGKIKARR
jgi:phosphonate transport system substrate-binding protein